MIPERLMRQAQRLDNGEIIYGNIFHIGVGSKTIMCIQTKSEVNGETLHPFYEIDSSTVEDVAVKPAKRYVDWFGSRQCTLDFSELVKGKQYRDATACPNCFMELVPEYSELTAKCVMNHCPNCGQRIDWEV